MAGLVIDRRTDGDYGIGRYSREVGSRLSDLAAGELRSVRHHPLLDPVLLARDLRRAGAGGYYAPNHFGALPPLAPCRQLLTLHDVILLEVPDETSMVKRAFLDVVVRRAALAAGTLFTVSTFSKERIVQRLRLPEDVVVVTGNGCSEVFFERTAAVSQRNPYVLCVSNAKPHKNIGLAARAACLLPAGVTMHWVGVTAGDLVRLGCPQAVPRSVFHTQISEAELHALYAGALALALPSHYEGFGLPAVEAMAQGLGVAYCCDAVDAVVAGTGARVAADDPAALAAALVALADSSEATRRQRQALARSHAWGDVALAVRDALTTRLH